MYKGFACTYVSASHPSLVPVEGSCVGSPVIGIRDDCVSHVGTRIKPGSSEYVPSVFTDEPQTPNSYYFLTTCLSIVISFCPIRQNSTFHWDNTGEKYQNMSVILKLTSIKASGTSLR